MIHSLNLLTITANFCLSTTAYKA
ncbi:hypothetical protein VCHENC02_3540A, partial [Vibrio harveyi]